MKMTTEDFNQLRTAVMFTLDCTPDAWVLYERKGISHIRYRWDVLNASRHRTTELYYYLNDAEIDTALKKIMGSEYPALPQRQMENHTC